MNMLLAYIMVVAFWRSHPVVLALTKAPRR